MRVKSLATSAVVALLLASVPTAATMATDSDPGEQPETPALVEQSNTDEGAGEDDDSAQLDPAPEITPAPEATTPESEETTGDLEAVTDLTAVADDGSVTLTWQYEASDEPSGYLVRWREVGVEDDAHGNDVDWNEPIATGSTETMFTVTNLDNGTNYVFQVAAINGESPGPWSLESEPVSPESDGEEVVRGPSAPRNLTLTLGRGQVTVTWDAPSDDGGRPITGYILRWSNDGGTSWQRKEFDAEARDSIVTGLTRGGIYTFRLRATNELKSTDTTTSLRSARFATLTTPQNGQEGEEAEQSIVLPQAALLKVAKTGSDSGTCGSEISPCLTIQQAISNAAPGDTIDVAAGTYNEGLTVNKSLTLLGPKVGIAPNDSSDPWSLSSGWSTGVATIKPPAAPNVHAIKILRGPGDVEVSIEGFAIDMDGTQSGQRYLDASTGTAGDGLTLSVRSNHFQNAEYSANGHWCLTGNKRLDLSVEGNRFTNADVSNGIAVWSNTDGNYLINENVWLDNGYTALNLNSPTARTTGSIKVQNNWIGNSSSVDDPSSSTSRQGGFIIAGPGPYQSGDEISGNTFRFIENLSIYFWDTFSGDLEVTNNLVDGYKRSSKLAAGLAMSSATAGAQVGGVSAELNAFTNPEFETATVFNRDDSGELNTASNWWGQSSGPVSGQIDGTDVLSSPWIVGYVDDPAKSGQPGFWPNRLVLNTNQLSAHTLSAGILSPTFASGITQYTASVPNSVSSVTVTPTWSVGSTVTVNGQGATSGQPSNPIGLNVGSNTITVVSTSGTDSATYTITLTRAAPDVGPGPAPGPGPTPTPTPTPSPTPTVTPTPVVEPVVVEDPESVTPAQVEALSPAQVATISPEVIRDLPPAAVAALSPEQAAALTPAQVSALRPARAAALQPAAVQALSPAQLAAMRPASVARLSPTAICTPVGEAYVLGETGLTPEQVAAFRPAAFGRMQPDQFEVMRPAQMTQLPQNLVNRIRPARARAMQPDTVAALTPEQLSVMRPRSVGALRLQAVALLTPEQIAAIRPRGIARMRDAQLRRLSPEQVAALTPRQRGALSAQQRQLLGLD